MLRELTHEELGYVSGGTGDDEIIVNGSVFRSSEVGSAVSGGEMGTVFLGGTSQYLAAGTAGQITYDGEEIIVNGATRIDPASSDTETQLERAFLTLIGGGYGNAEQNADGSWSIVASFLPTPDQALFEANQAAANTGLMVALIPNAQARADLANALTDRGLNMSGHNLAAFYQEYKSSSSSGSGLTVFVNWIADRISQPPIGN